MKVRIGVGLGAAGPSDPEELAAVVGDLERLGYDSLWLSEVLTAGAVDPLVGLTFAATCSSHLKLGTTMVLPGRNPVRLAKELATLDRLSSGRLLLVFVLGLRQAPEQAALGVPAEERGAQVDELLPLLRRLWAGDVVDHRGRWASFEGVRLQPLPVQVPLEPWLGGSAASALRRTGRLGDGWLPSLLTPEEAARGRATIDEVAAEHGRCVDPEHFGVSLGYARAELADATRRALASRRRDRPVEELVPLGPAALRRLIQRFVEHGFSKFVLRPLDPPSSWPDELHRLADDVLDLQS